MSSECTARQVIARINAMRARPAKAVRCGRGSGRHLRFVCLLTPCAMYTRAGALSYTALATAPWSHQAVHIQVTARCVRSGVESDSSCCFVPARDT